MQLDDWYFAKRFNTLMVMECEEASTEPWFTQSFEGENNQIRLYGANTSVPLIRLRNWCII